MRRSVATGLAFIVISAVARMASAQGGCAVLITTDNSGQSSIPRKMMCEAGAILAVVVCNSDTAAPHTATVSKSMLHKMTKKTYDTLMDDVSVTAQAATASGPTCALGIGTFDAAGDFGNKAGKKPFGTYAYNLAVDFKTGDPDLDVVPPSGVKRPAARSGRGARP